MLIYMIRHGRTDWNRDRRVMGVNPVPLNAEGRGMVEALAGFLSRQKIGVIYTGTLVRAMETAEILGGAWGARIIEEPLLNESAYEGWVGKTYSELGKDEQFRLYGTRPSLADFSWDEGMKDIQQRILKAIARIIEENGSGKAALVSHSDVIKPAMTHYLGMDLDHMHRLSVANASVSLLDTGAPGWPRFRYINLMPWKWDRTDS